MPPDAKSRAAPSRPAPLTSPTAKRAEVVPTVTPGGLTVPDVTGLDVLSAALAYAQAGWYILPVGQGTKRPLPELGSDWQHKSSRDPEVITAWLAGTGHGIALHAGRSGSVILDVDNLAGLAICPALVDALAAHVKAGHPVQQSRPGRGHYVFTQPPGRSLGNGKGRLTGNWGEVRGRNGVILAAPTPHPDGGEYRWLAIGPVPELPAGLAARLPDGAEAEDAATDAEVAAFLAAHTAATQPHKLELTVADLEKRIIAGESRHDTALTKTCQALREAVQGFFPAAEAVRRIGEVFTAAACRDITGRRARSRAEAASEYRGITAWAVAQVTASPAGDQAGQQAEDDQPPMDRAAVLRSKLLDSAALATIPEPVPLIDGLLYSDSLAWLTGKRGCGKSFIALDMAGHISLGLGWHGHATKPGPVLYIAAEGAPGLRQRVRAWENHNGTMAVTFLPEAIRLPADGSVVGRLAADIGAGLVIIDTQARVTVGLDENSSKDMGLLVDAAERIRGPGGACVLLVHHEPRNGEHPRGHSTMDGAGTTLLRITKDGPLITLTNPKQKDAPEALPVRLMLTPHLGSAVIGPITPVGLGNLQTDSETTVRETLMTLVGLKGGASYTELKAECGLPVSTFKYALKALVSRGEVRNVGSNKRSLYVFAIGGERPMEGQ
jgi:hypothetical protein